MMRDTLWSACRFAAKRERRRRQHRRWGQLNQTGGHHHHPNPLSPEICTTAGREDQYRLLSQKIYLKMSKEAKPHGQLKTPRQKPVEAQTLLHHLQGGLRRNSDPARKQSAPTGKHQTRMLQQLRIIMLSRWSSMSPLTSAQNSLKWMHQTVK